MDDTAQNYPYVGYKSRTLNDFEERLLQEWNGSDFTHIPLIIEEWVRTAALRSGKKRREISRIVRLVQRAVENFREREYSPLCIFGEIREIMEQNALTP